MESRIANKNWNRHNGMQFLSPLRSLESQHHFTLAILVPPCGSDLYEYQFLSKTQCPISTHRREQMNSFIFLQKHSLCQFSTHGLGFHVLANSTHLRTLHFFVPDFDAQMWTTSRFFCQFNTRIAMVMPLHVCITLITLDININNHQLDLTCQTNQREPGMTTIPTTPSLTQECRH